MRKRIFVVSPLAPSNIHSFDANVDLAKRLCRAVVLDGHAPMAPHLLYPLFLNENDEEERKIGISAGLAWLTMAQEVWAYATDFNAASRGMKQEIDFAGQLGIKIVYMPPVWSDIQR